MFVFENKKSCIFRARHVLALALFFTTTVYAQTKAEPAAVPVESAATLPSSPMSSATAAEIQKISENMTVLQAQFNQLELQAKIAAKQRELMAVSGGMVSSFGSKNGSPAIVSVAGLMGSLKAVLVFPGGVTQRVQEGDVIEDRRVSKIAVNEVVLTDLKGKNVQRLSFGTTPITREAGSSIPGSGAIQAPPGGMPSVPMAR
ncbi:type IV pilus biogenesis protein PilP [Polaromonas aquatica]|uniref:Type IV pilus biogenesis protein PilP n=1 Tax=Polaromonas aquatica TaxID=332657 RepID=A0ABW1TUJ2_9BURK